MEQKINPIGNIYISERAISTIASQVAIESYGVVGLAAKNIFEGAAQLVINNPQLGVDIRYRHGTVEIDLYLILEYGMRITSVASSISSAVRYQVEKTLGLPVSQVNIHVRGLRISDPD